MTTNNPESIAVEQGDDLCRFCGKPFLPAHGLNGDCGMFLSGGKHPMEGENAHLRDAVAALTEEVERLRIAWWNDMRARGVSQDAAIEKIRAALQGGDK